MPIAIITGDLIGSTKYRPELREKAINTLKHTLEEEKTIEDELWLNYEWYRGDSVQIEVYKLEKSLWLALLIRAALKMIPYIPESKRSLLESKGADVNKARSVFTRSFADIRLSIGIGEAEYKHSSIVESDGEAYRLSGRTLDTMKKKGQNIIIRTRNEELNEQFEIDCKFLDYVIDRWSTFSAEVVFLSLKGLKDIEIAEKLKISPTAIHLRKKAAGWDAIDLMLQGFESKIMKNI